MKKMLLSVIACLPVLASAQTFSDDFESYATGSYIAENSTLWTTWSGAPGTTEDATASDAYAHGGTMSAYFYGPAAAGPVDFVHDFGNLTSGHYVLTLWMRVDTAAGGYFNLMHDSNAASYEWAFDAYFSNDGTGYVLVNNVEYAFTHVQAEWNEVMVDINMDVDSAEFFVNGTSVHQWQWSVQNNAATGTNQLAWLDIFAAAPTGVTPASFYIDDVSFEAATSGVQDLVRNGELLAWPNPAKDMLHVPLEAGLSAQARIELVDFTGKVLTVPVRVVKNAFRLDLSSLADGVYFVRVIDGTVQKVGRVVKN